MQDTNTNDMLVRHAKNYHISINHKSIRQHNYS